MAWVRTANSLLTFKANLPRPDQAATVPSHSIPGSKDTFHHNHGIPMNRRPFRWTPPSTAPITLPPITAIDLTDADLGLPDDPLAQESAERAIRAATAFRLKQEAIAGLRQTVPGPVTITVPDGALSFEDVPPDVLHGIATELRRLVARPRRCA